MPSHPQLAAERFGAFELNREAGELRKHGIRIKLHEKPLQILLALVEHRGETVTRKELQERLWPQDTFVDFENGLNNAVSRLRKTLGGSAKRPRFIATVPRRGYRFLPKVSRSFSSSQNARLCRWLMGM
jgi:cholera toxin transcriptional activator